MKSIDGSSIHGVKTFMKLVTLSLVMMIACYSYHSFKTYDSIKVVVKDVATIEYGDANYNLNKFIKEVDGEVVSIKKDADTSVLGEQEVILEVQKDDIVKEVPIVVNVVDSVAPVIKIKNEKITISQGEVYNLLDNVDSVNDLTDGDLSYSENASSENSKYYSMSYDGDINSVGSHEITIQAVDASGNVSSQTFTLEVVKPAYVEPVFNNLGPNIYGGDISSIAYSLIGRPYISGGNGPYGFDCSGFVQYVYSQVGIGISRSTSTQVYDGVAVSYEAAQPGDIVLWGYPGGSITHSSIYVGDGMMIHAANPSTGVILSNIAGWVRGSGTQILSVRRIK